MKLPDIKGKNVLIIGCPASGKTYVSKLLSDAEHRLVHTDRYMDLGYVDSLYELLRGLSLYKGLTIVEGVLGYRLLRKGYQKGSYRPDVVIEMKVSESRMMDTYKNERDPNKIRYLKSFNKMHAKILAEYKEMVGEDLPDWYVIENNY